MPNSVLPLSAANGQPERLSDSPAMLLTAAELARELRTSTRSIWRMESAGKLPAPIRWGRAPRWPRETILRWLAAGCPDRREFERLTVASATRK
ncbi:MAG: helix-turn-helix domain-containing protein [Pirellulales bacterium]|nr:helix-turn-helix domain-containing protein [Pirellulales bacterium]